MKPAGIVGIILIVVGVIALAYQGITYTKSERERVELGPLKIEATVQRPHTIQLPPILGVAALAGGVVLLIVSSRKGTA